MSDFVFAEVDELNGMLFELEVKDEKKMAQLGTFSIK